jgi:hypothetical protein
LRITVPFLFELLSTKMLALGNGKLSQSVSKPLTDTKPGCGVLGLLRGFLSFRHQAPFRSANRESAPD